jgi:hypothetical protein
MDHLLLVETEASELEPTALGPDHWPEDCALDPNLLPQFAKAGGRRGLARVDAAAR